MAYIYKITNTINNKVYIGQTKKPIQTRLKEHIRMAENNYYIPNKHLPHFYQAILKYGKQNFIIEEIEECPIEKLNEREKYWIQYYNSFLYGYNSTTGGQDCGPRSSQYVLQYNLQGNYIQTFKSAEDAANYINLSSITIRRACSQLITAGGYQWRYFSINFPLQINSIDTSNKRQHKRAVKQFNLQGQLINRFDSIKEASNYTKVTYSNIQRACQEKGTTRAGNYQWRFADDNDVPTNIEKDKNTKRIPKTRLSTIQYDKNNIIVKEWNTIKEAADTLQIRSSSIISVCEGKQKTCGGFVWKYKI